MAQWDMFRRFIALAALAVIMAVTGVTACVTEDSPPEARARQSGEAVFRGLVFGEGRIAAQLPEIWGHLPHQERTNDEQATVEGIKAQLIADIREADITFLDRFGSAIQSGDHLRIEGAIDESAVLMNQVIRKRAPPDEVKGISYGQAIAVAVDTVLYFTSVANAVTLINVAAEFNIAVAANFVYIQNFFWAPSSQALPADSQLGHDQVVEMIATRLAVE